jgi:hypothetical protein
VEWKFTGTAAPVQAEGTIDGFPFYFRARHNEWTFAVADGCVPDPVLIESPADGFFRSSKYEGASFVPLEIAIQLIERCISAYRSR